MLTNKNTASYILLFIFIILFISITAKGLLIPQPGDENVYYYMGKLVSEGKFPYRDFFYAHPPLHIYLISFIYKLFGFNIVILKLVPLICTLISAILIFFIAKNRYGNDEALAASLLFLFSYSVMFNSVFSFGIELAVMFLVAGIFFLLNKNYYLMSGIFFALAGITRLLTLIPITIIFAAVLLTERKKSIAAKASSKKYIQNFEAANLREANFWMKPAAKLIFSFLVVFLSVNIIFASLSNNYITQVYKFHLLKSSQSGENLMEYIDIIKLNWILFSSSLLFFFLKEKKQISIFAIISVVYLIFLMALKNIFGFYFMVVFPFLAILGSYSIINALPTKKNLRIFLLLVISAIFAWNLASDFLFLEKVGFSGFERGNDLSDFIKSRSVEGTLLFGDESVVPLLALMSNKRLALDLVDTNNQVFISGIKNLKEVLSSLKGKEIIFVIRSRRGISYFTEVKEFVNTNCEFLSSFHDSREGDYILYRCR